MTSIDKCNKYESSENASESRTENESEESTVEDIVWKRAIGENARYLVEWEGYKEDENTWELAVPSTAIDRKFKKKNE